MKITYLSAKIPIVKAYEKTKTAVIYTPYPMIYEFSSHETEVRNIESWHKSIILYAKKDACILKGASTRLLVDESRAGTTDPDAKTSWICLDIDGIQTENSITDVLGCIKIVNVDYILQWSSSMGIENKTGLRCHVFIILDEPTSPALLKNWLKGLNLNTPLLSSQISLTKTNNALRWPLDITTCQNDKLIYIAPPSLKGIDDPYPGSKRIELIKGLHRTFALPTDIPTPDILNELVVNKLNELRKTLGLAKRKFTTKHAGTIEYLAQPGEATVTGQKLERGFTYFNLNGGDSWGYYHPEDNPEFIYNFKGEPTYRTQDLLPTYWAHATKQERPTSRKETGKLYLGYRDSVTGNYMNAIVDNDSGEIVLVPAKTEKQLNDFLQIYGQPKITGPIPLITPTFNPDSSLVYDEVEHTLNHYRAPTLLSALGTWKKIQRLVEHVLGNDMPTIEHFYNWLACALQTRNSTGTAWIWHGTTGTGKGILLRRVITPMFGEANVEEKRMDELDDRFSGYMQHKLILFIDEMEQSRSLYGTKLEAKLKNLITEPRISVRDLYQPHRMVTNYTNMIFASNKPDPVMVQPDDRRFNVGVYQPTNLLTAMAYEEIDEIDGEVPAFMNFLLNRPVDRRQARTPVINLSRDQLIATNRIAIDVVADALNTGDLGFFWDNLRSTPPSSPLVAMRYEEYKTLVIELVTNVPTALSRESLHVLFSWCAGDMPESPNKFTSLLKHHQVHMVHIWLNNRTVRGVRVQWTALPTWLAQARLEIASGLI